MSGSEWGQLPNASSGMRHILFRASRYKMCRPLRNALGSCPHSDPTATYSKYDSQTYSGADINLVARLCRALIYGGRSQSSGLTQFLIRLSERSGNRTPPAELPQDPPWCYFSEHSAGRKKPPPHEVRSGGFLNVRGRSEKQHQGGPGQEQPTTGRYAIP